MIKSPDILNARMPFQSKENRKKDILATVPLYLYPT